MQGLRMLCGVEGGHVEERMSIWEVDEVLTPLRQGGCVCDVEPVNCLYIGGV